MTTMCWCPSKIGMPHIRGLIGCQSYKPRRVTIEDLRSVVVVTERITEYRLTWEMPDIYWQEGYQSVNDFTEIWDRIPWEKPVQKVVRNLNEILDQWRTLKYWEESKTQPIRNVHVHTRSFEPTDWAEMAFPGDDAGTGSLPPVSSR